MTFPVIAATNQGVSGANTTNHTINLPTGIVAGNLLMIFFTTDGNNSVLWGDFTQLVATSNGSAVFQAVAYKIAVGNEGSTVNVTTAYSERSAHVTYRITGASVFSPVATTVARTDNNYKGPYLSPGGTFDFLWICAAGHDNGTIGITPTNGWIFNYPLSRIDVKDNSSSQGVGLAVSARQYNSSNETPGSPISGFWTSSAIQVAVTIAVYPAGVEPYASIYLVHQTPPPLKDQTYYQEIWLQNTGPMAGRLWVKTWLDGVPQGIIYYANIPVNGVAKRQIQKTMGASHHWWIIQAGHNNDSTTYDIEESVIVCPLHPMINETTDPFTINIEGH